MIQGHLLCVLFVVLCVFVPHGNAQTCTGASVSTGGSTSGGEGNVDTDQLLGSFRTITTTQEVTTLTMPISYNSDYGSSNANDVHISIALYGPQTCPSGIGVNMSALLATTATITLAAGSINDYTVYPISESLLNPVIIGPGVYAVMMATDDDGCTPLVQGTTSTTQILVVDAFSRGRSTFANSALLLGGDFAADTLATIVGNICTGPVNVTAYTCAPPPPLVVYPINAAAALPCNGSVLSTNSFSDPTFVTQVPVSTDTIRLQPFTVPVTQYVYSVGILFGPNTEPNIYTLRPALYSMGIGSTFTLLAQCNQQTINGSQLAGQMTVWYCSLTAPLLVQGGTTLWLNRPIDQNGLSTFDMFNAIGYYGTTSVSSSTSAPTSLVASTYGAQVEANGILGCPAPPSSASGNLCLLMYSLPGNVDYPWSVALSLRFVYNTTAISTPWGTAVSLLSGSGIRTYTNRVGSSFSTSLNLAPLGTDSANNLLYLGSTFPVDENGITWSVTGSVSPDLQIPGAGPIQLVSLINIINASGVILEAGSSRADGRGQAFLSSIPGFVNVTIGASNINALSVDYIACQAPITFTNGLRSPFQPSASNGGINISFSYFITDGTTYSTITNLTLTTNSAFAGRDSLGDQYQRITSITGTRSYTYLPMNATVTSIVTGMVSSSSASFRFYPYALLSAAPGVYSTNTAPFFDAAGVQFSLSNAVPSNGAAPGAGTLSNTLSLYVSNTEAAPSLVEGPYINAPLISKQQQTYTFM